MVKIKATNTGTAAAEGTEPVRPDSYAKFEALIEAYKKQNPKKYEQKKEELERKLAALK